MSHLFHLLPASGLQPSTGGISIRPYRKYSIPRFGLKSMRPAVSMSAIGERLQALSKSIWEQFIQRDAVVLGTYIGAALLMTYPLIVRMNSIFIGLSPDVYVEPWTTWWQMRALSGEVPLFYTRALFYPQGMDAIFSLDRWPELLLHAPLSLVLPPTTVYNLIGLLSLIAGAYTAFLFAEHLLGNRWAAWLTGAIFAFQPRHLVTVFEQPSVGRLHWLPIVLLLLLKGMEQLQEQGRLNAAVRRFFVPAALLMGANAFINLKIFIFIGLTAALFAGLYALLHGLWRSGPFYKAMAVVSIVTLAMAAPIILPFVQVEWLDAALAQQDSFDGVDMLSYVVPPYMDNMKAWHGLPVLIAAVTDFRYWYDRGIYLSVGAVFAAILSIGGVAAKLYSSRELASWVILLVVFATLSFGATPTINAQTYYDIALPYKYVGSFFLFQAIGAPWRFVLLALLPFSILAGYGVRFIHHRLDGVPAIRSVVLAGLLVFVLYDLRWSTLPTFDAVVPAIFTESDGDQEGALLNLPISRRTAKVDMYYQTFHEIPLLEGMAARQSDNVSDYIHSNPVLRILAEDDHLECEQMSKSAIEDLLADGFTFLVYTYEPLSSVDFEEPAPLPNYVSGMTPIFTDGRVAIYPLYDFQENWIIPGCR
ncbi:MAG: hypothetical protein GYB64_19650 [Chloroflexi bacterium]|nr:hypothetical protein [Chloroflexota bacterium]